MSKAKKIISMLLAVMMVLSVVPASVVAMAATPAEMVATFRAPTTELVTFATDTSGTTEVIRVAGAEGAFTLGSTIVAATPSGIPRADSGSYIDLAYAGETPALPTIVFKITGVRPDAQPTVVSSLGSNITINADTNVVVEGSGANTSYTYKWTIASGGTATQGTGVTYTITYLINGVAHTAYAYSFVEDILIMNGYIGYKKQSEDHKTTTRHSHIVQLGGKNMYSGWYNNLGEHTKSRAYINYASGSTTSNADGTGSILGAGSETNCSTDVDAYAIDDAVTLGAGQTAKGVLIKTKDESSADWSNAGYGLDGNRPESTLYIDKRNENLSNLNVRVSLQNGEYSDWWHSTLKNVEIVSGAISFGGNDQWTNVLNGQISLITIGEISKNVDTTQITKVGSEWRYATFGGQGPAIQHGQTSYQNTMLVYTYSDINGSSDQENHEIGAISIVFKVYTTIDLYNVFYGIMKGANINDGSDSYTTSNYITYIAANGDTQHATSAQTIEFTKGAHPQASYYTAGWSNFLEKYQQAGRVLANPQTSQTEINKATVELISAYNGLAGFNPTVNYTVKHCISGTATEIVDATTNGYTAKAQKGTVDAGTKITAYAADITGYVLDGDSVKYVTATGETSEVTITFFYNRENFNVNAQTNNENLKEVLVGTETKDLRVQIYPVPFGTKFYKSTATNGDGDASRPGVGTKPYYEFVDWYYKDGSATGVWDETQIVEDSFEMTNANVTIYARWDVAPVHIYATPMLDDGTVINNGNKLDLGSVKPTADGKPVEFARPGDDKTTVTGYLFVGYYEKYDGGFTGSVEWPQYFSLGDSNRNIVARYADVNGKIVFEPNGGTACSDFTFTAPQTINKTDLPEPTKVGYTFDGWYKDVGLTQPVFADGATSFEQTTATGFIAYAKWEPKEVVIHFDTAVGANPSKYDTRSIASTDPVKVGEAVPDDFIPANPRRFGYEFAGWLYNGRVFDFSKVPVTDSDITLVATWRRTSESAFIELTAIEKVLGQENTLDADNTSNGEDEDEIVQHGDVITVRMTSMTNFYVGSSLFIFMYDADFYELIGSGKDAFTLNSEDSYISGINAKYTAVTNSASLPWPASLNSTDYNAMQIAIDPTVALDNFNAEPMDGNTWMIEFKLRVKDTAEGSGTIYMDNAWTRTPDNIMGTMFYGWAASAETSVIETENNRVTPDLGYASRTLRIDTEENVETTVTLDTVDGTWDDGTTADKTYTGYAGAEILDYTAPTKTGFTLDGWYATEGDTTSEEWIEGYYPPEETPSAKYYANWAPNSYPVIFYWDAGSDSVYKEASALYMEDIAADIVAEPTRAGYDFAGWVDKDGNLVTLPTAMTVADDAGYHLYATWTPATDTKFTIKIYYPSNTYDPTNPNSSYYAAPVVQTTNKNNAAFQGTTGQTVALVEAVPADADPNTLYITLDVLRPVVGGNFIFNPDDANNYAGDPNKVIIDSDAIAADGSTVLEAYYIGKMITYTFDANGGTFANGSATLTKSGRFQSTFAGLAESELPTRTGYDFAGWNRTPVTTFTADATYTAQWTAKKVHVRFMLSETEQYGDLVEVDMGTAPAAPTEPSKNGWTFVGWNTDPAATTGVKTLPVVNDVDGVEGYAITYYAIFTKTPYTVTYNLVDPETGAVEQYGATETYYMDEVVTVKPADAADLVKKGYTFDGWKIGANAAGASFTMGTENVELTGTYTAKSINVKFYADEGAYESGDAYVEVATTFNETINLPATNPAKTGYTFTGWAATPVAAAGSTDLGTLTEEEASFYAVYTPEEHTYYIDVYEMGLDGEYPDDPTRTTDGRAYVDDTVTITSTDDLEGFTLVTAASQTGTVPAEGDLRFTVKYERNKYDLVYVIDGDETVVEYFYGATPDASNAPDTTKVGHTFLNWDPAVPATIPAEDTVVTAVYETNKYNVKFYADQNKLDSDLVYNQQHEYATEIPVVGEQFRTGYVFKGWAYDGTTEVIDLAANTQYVPAGDVTFVGIWEADSFRLNYRGATGIHEYFMVPYGTPVAEWPVPATNPVKEGSYFDGWSDSGYTTMPADVVIINPVWVTETYKLQFANTGDTTYGENNIITVTYGDAFDGVANPVWAGHVFEGWDNVIPTEIGDLGDDGATVVFTASWRNEKYILHFVNTGDTTIADKNVEFGDTIEATADPVWAGHVFDKWDVTPPTTIGDLGNDGATINYTAQWITETYTIKFLDTNDAGDTIEVPATFGGTITVPTGLTKTGYVFAGWTDAEGNDAVPPTSITDLGENNAVITYKAKWTKDTFTVTFDADNGSELESADKEFEAEVTAPEVPEKEGHVFSHWINTADNSTVTFPFIMPAGNLNLKAVWTKETYQVKFADTDDAGTVITKDVTYGDTIEIPANLVKTGYVFDGWDETPSTEIGDLGNNGAVVTYTAQWREKTYTLKFTDTGDTTIEDKVVKFGDTIEVPTGLTKNNQGYYFTETWKDANGNAVTPPTTIEDMGADNAEFTYVAQWAKETYTIKFVTGENASAVADITAQYGDAVNKPSNPTKEGHSFVQWNDAEGNAYTIQPIMPDLGENNATITLTAQWSVVGYTVTFYAADGYTVFYAEEVNYGENIADVVPADLPEKEYYIALGWSLTEGDTVAITDFGTMPAHNVIYYPAYERVKVTLKLLEGTTAEVFEVDESNPDLKVGYIRGLKPRLTKSALETTYVGVTGDGEIRITPSWSKMNICGTGTVIEVYDNVDKVVVERYYVVIYGDVNGDSGISATDVTAILKETNSLTGWSVEGTEEYNKAYALAADIKNDGEINGLDATGLRDVTLAVSYIDQVTGTAIYK